MKILKLSTNTGGGATTAAERQAKALRIAGNVVKHMYVRQNWQNTKVKITEEDNDLYISALMPNFLKTDLIFQNYLNDNRTKISNTYMSLHRKSTPFDTVLIDYIIQEGFEIIHCHWTSNFISSRLLQALTENNVRVVITGHDMNHFTGACHYDAGCGKFKSGCLDCPQLKSDAANIVTKSMAERLTSYSSLNPHYIFPSNWLDKEYKSSLIGSALGGGSSSVLRNCIDTRFFKPANKEKIAALRESLGFSSDELLIVSGAENNHEIRKGFHYFEHAFKTLNRSLYGNTFKKTITFVAFGGGDHVLKPSHPNVNYRHVGVLEEHQVRDLFQMSDLLAFTSIEENFANIILESLMCGCPVLGFNIGGIPDIVESEVNGELVKTVSESAFSQSMVNLITKKGLTELRERTVEWRKQSYTHYSFDEIAKKLTLLYSQLLQGDESVRLV